MLSQCHAQNSASHFVIWMQEARRSVEVWLDVR